LNLTIDNSGCFSGHGISIEGMNRRSEDGFKAKKAVIKLKNENRPDLAAFSLALDSEREMERSELVPLAPQYQKVTDYLTNQRDQSTF